MMEQVSKYNDDPIHEVATEEENMSPHLIKEANNIPIKTT